MQAKIAADARAWRTVVAQCLRDEHKLKYYHSARQSLNCLEMNPEFEAFVCDKLSIMEQYIYECSQYLSLEIIADPEFPVVFYPNVSIIIPHYSNNGPITSIIHADSPYGNKHIDLGYGRTFNDAVEQTQVLGRTTALLRNRDGSAIKSCPTKLDKELAVVAVEMYSWQLR